MQMQASTWICTYQMQATKFMSLLPLLVCSSCPRILILLIHVHDRTLISSSPLSSKDNSYLCSFLAVRILLSVHSRTVRDNLAERPPLNLYTAARLALPLLNSAQPLADRPRSFGGPSAVYFCDLRIFLQSLWWTSPMNGGLSAHYPRTVRSTKFQTAQNFANFLNSNSNLGSLLI